MNERQDVICRLCLKASHNVLLIDETVREMLEVLFLKMNFNISDNASMCENCTEIVKMALYFKSMCLDAEEMILLFYSDKNKSNLDLRDVYAHNSKEIVAEDAKICRFCLKKVDQGFIFLDVLMKENIFSEMLKEYMFEKDLSISKNPLICFNCRDNLESYFEFLRKSRDTEKKINAYQQSKGQKNTRISLKDVFEYFSDETPICVVKKEKIPMSECSENTSLNINNSTVHIKEEFDVEQRSTNDDTLPRCPARLNNDAEIETVPLEVNTQTLKIELEELTIKEELTLNENPNICICYPKKTACNRCNLQFETVSFKPRIYRCKLCPFQGIWIKPHLLTHRDMSEVRIYRCDTCGFESKHRNSLRSHLLTHKDISEVPMFKCDLCDYKSKFSSGLRVHSTIHKADAKKYECTSCDFKTIHRYNLKRHSIKHKSQSEAKMYKCTVCDYESRYAETLQEHIITHKDLSEVAAVHCTVCGLWFKNKKRLTKHMHVHTKPKIHKCSLCPYKTRHKYSLKSHALKHKSESEVKMYKCKLCDFQTKYRTNVQNHMVLHKDTPEIRLYKCPSCRYQGKSKYSLRKHMLIHTKRRRKHHCTECDHKTYSPNLLKAHMLVHKSLSEVRTYQCTEKGCKFVTKRRKNQQKHLLTHGTDYVCKQCSFETRVKTSFKQHLLIHEEERGLEIFRCKCGYRTKYEHNLKSHRMTHKKMRYKTWRFDGKDD